MYIDYWCWLYMQPLLGADDRGGDVDQLPVSNSWRIDDLVEHHHHAPYAVKPERRDHWGQADDRGNRGEHICEGDGQGEDLGQRGWRSGAV
jgi:hypothetical protein